MAISVIVSASLLTLIAPVSTLANSPVCLLKIIKKKDSSSRVDLTVGTRKISLLGWKHPNPRHNAIEETMDLVHRSSAGENEKNCFKSATALKELLVHPGWHPDSANELLEEMRTVNKEFRVDIVGLERTKAGLSDVKRFHEYMGIILSEAGKACPENLIFTQKATMLYPGPEFLFAREFESTVKIEPLEDAKARAEAFAAEKVLSSLKPFTFDELKPNSAELLSRLFKKIALMQPVSKEEINAVLESERPGKLADRMRRTIDANINWYAQIPLRNEKIADRILAGKGNYVVVLGNLHIAQLAERIQSRCLTGEGQTMPVPAASAPRDNEPSDLRR